ncbi:hypothetical protein JX131_003500 [Escherichia coli]|nr:hypothetical protein [Escherichia coli]
MVQTTPDIGLSGAVCTPGVTSSQMVRSSSENDIKAHFCQAEIYNLRGHVSKNGKADSILTKRRGPA